MQITPTKNISKLHFVSFETLPTVNRKYPMNRFPSPQRVLTIGDDNPLPGGFANGLGKLSPDTPCIKCGTELIKKRPAKKQAM